MVGKRIHRRFTLEQLADKSEISKSFLWEVEQGSDISGERLLRPRSHESLSTGKLLSNMQGESYRDRARARSKSHESAIQRSRFQKRPDLNDLAPAIGYTKTVIKARRGAVR